MNVRKLIKLFNEGGLLKLFSLGFIIFGFGKVFQILLFILVARYLSQADFGKFSLAISMSHILSIFIVLAIPSAGMRLVATFEGRKNWPILKGYLKFAISWVLLISICSSLILLVAHLLITQNNLKDICLLLSTILPLIAIGVSRAGLMRGFNSMVGALLPTEIFVPLLAMAFIVILNSDNLIIVAMCYVFGLILAEVFGGFLLMRRLPDSLSDVKAQYEIRDWLSISLPIQASSIARIVLQRSDLIFVGMFAGLEASAIYAVGQRLAQAVQVIGRVSNNAVSPLLAREYHSENPNNVLVLVKKSCLINIIIAVPTVIFLSIASPYIVKLFGPNYAASGPILIILCIGQLSNAVFNPVNQALNMTDLEKVQLSIVAVTSVLALIILPVSAIYFGALGTAIATASLFCFLNLTSYLVGFKLLKTRIEAKR